MCFRRDCKENIHCNQIFNYIFLSDFLNVSLIFSYRIFFVQILEYLEHLLLPNDSPFSAKFFDEMTVNLQALRKPIHMCVASRVDDRNGISSYRIYSCQKNTYRIYSWHNEQVNIRKNNNNK